MKFVLMLISVSQLVDIGHPRCSQILDSLNSNLMAEINCMIQLSNVIICNNY